MKNNRISFAKQYTELEKRVIRERFSKVVEELASMEVGYSAFKLNDEVAAFFNPTQKRLYFKLNDFDVAVNEDSYQVLFLSKWEGIKNELIAEKQAFEESEARVLCKGKDGVDIVCNKIESGKKVKISKYFDLESLTKEEKLAFIKRGYGYDLYEQSKKWGSSNSEVNDAILTSFLRYQNQYCSYELNESGNKKLADWIQNNPDKCLRPRSKKGKQ